MLPTITNITTLSDEVKSGQIYGVIQLYKLLGDKPALEKKPADIFGNRLRQKANDWLVALLRI